jgi:hypothetical protein
MEIKSHAEIMDETKMIKKTFACLLIVMLSMTTLFAVQLASGAVHHISGVNYPYSDGRDPVYSECNHDTFPGADDNSEVGLGVLAKYKNASHFDRAWWDFNAQYGNGNVAMFSGLSIDACLNGDEHHYYTCYDEPTWTIPSGANWTAWYVHVEKDPNDTPVDIGAKESVEGLVRAAFYHPSYPPWAPYWGPYWWLEAYTQNPSDPNDPNGWSFLYAH